MGQRLLFVDSDRRFVQDHQVALESAFDVDFLYGTDGLPQRLESGQYAAVLICVEVSENKGYALCSAIRKNPLLTAVRVILISAKATGEEYGRHQSLKGKADLYLHKPIDPKTLVAALTPLLPLRGVDPDNPLGDLDGSDLGEEWLESLKTELETEESPAPPLFTPTPPVPPEPSKSHQAPSMASQAIALPSTLPLPQITRDAGRVEFLEARVQDLEAKLQDLGELLVKKDQEVEGLRSEHERATRNLDEAEQRQAELGELQQKLKDTEEALLAQEGRATRAETEGTHLQEKLDDTEKAGGDLRSRVEKGERQVAELQATTASADRRCAELEEEIGRFREHAATHQATAEKLRALEDQINGYEARVQELQSQLETRNSDLAERAQEGDALKVDIAGLEATLRGQRRELADQSGRLGSLSRECETMQTRLAEHESRRLELEASLLEKDSQLQSTNAEAAELRRVRQDLEARLAQAEKELARIVVDHEKQQMELMQGIDEREAHLNRLNAGIDAQRERIANLEREKREIEGHLNEKSSRLAALSGAVSDLEAGIRRASDLTRPV
jgi:chromosome segregation ATPase